MTGLSGPPGIARTARRPTPRGDLGAPGTTAAIDGAMLRAAALLALAALAACDDTSADACAFESGRACAVGATCLGAQGDECNYATCDIVDGEPRLIATAIGCAAAPIEPAPDGPFVCDPAALDRPFTPPQAPCPLGGLWTIEDNAWGRCVPASPCEPLACDPEPAGDGCPSLHVCDPATRTCRVAASDAASAPPSVPRH
jgi:hypothetical protein